MAVTGRDSLLVEIAGLPIVLSTADAELRAELAGRFGNFLSSSPERSAHFTIDVVDSPPCVAAPDLRVDVAGDDWRMSRGDFDASWNRRTGRGRIVQTRNPYSTDSVLRIVQSSLLADGRGFLIHASSVVVGGQAYVFTGPSGAGKTTIATLAPRESVLLTDEISCIRETPRGWFAYGTPYAGELGTSGAAVAAPIAAVLSLAQGEDDRVEARSSGEAVRTLMRNILFFARDQRREAAVLESACALAAAVPFGRLTFRKHPEAWATVLRAWPMAVAS